MLSWFQKIRRPLAVAIGLFIIYMSLRAQVNLTQYVSDKTMHFLAYAVWTAIACATPRGIDRLALYAAIIFATGLAVELIQPDFGRDKSLWDLAANCLGIAAGILAAFRARRWLHAEQRR